MKYLHVAAAFYLLTVFVAHSSAASADSAPSIEEIWKLVQTQQQEIEKLQQELATAKRSAEVQSQKTKITEDRLDSTAEYVEQIVQNNTDGQAKTSIGGYGELHYNNINVASSSKNSKEADFHRFVLFFEHEFSDQWQFYSEFELEHGLSKDTADGSNSGEVELEQAFLQRALNDEHYLRTGVFLLPIGTINETHEPPTFYGVERNDVENIIVPGTWWEAGAGVGGHYSNGISWDFAVHTGLETPISGSNAFRVRSGRQKVSKANANNLAYTLRGSYTGIQGLSVSASLHHQSDISQFSGDGVGSANLLTLNGSYTWESFSLKTLWSKWNIEGALVKAAGADEQTGWYVEPAYTFLVNQKRTGIYARYEDLDAARNRDKFDQWEIGLNYWPSENLVFKVDYRKRNHDLGSEAERDFKAFDLGLGYNF